MSLCCSYVLETSLINNLEPIFRISCDYMTNFLSRISLSDVLIDGQMKKVNIPTFLLLII